MSRNKKTLDPKDPRYMTEEQEQIVNLILSNNELKSGKDVSNIFNELRGKVIQRLLDAEMEEFLGYDKSKHGEKENKNRYRRNNNMSPKRSRRKIWTTNSKKETKSIRRIWWDSNSNVCQRNELKRYKRNDTTYIQGRA